MDQVFEMVAYYVDVKKAAGQEVSKDLMVLAGIVDLMQHMYEDEDREATFEEAITGWVQSAIDDEMVKVTMCDETDEEGWFICPTCGGMEFSARVVHVGNSQYLSKETVIGLKCKSCPEEFSFSNVDWNQTEKRGE
jgi:hypothetical protein